MSADLHHVYVLSGTPFEIGRQHGLALAQEIVAEMSSALQEYSSSRGETPEATLRAFFAMYAPVVADMLPGAMDEVRGLAEGSGVSVDAAFFAAYRDGTPASFARDTKSEEGCTAFACTGSSSATGGVVIGKSLYARVVRTIEEKDSVASKQAVFHKMCSDAVETDFRLLSRWCRSDQRHQRPT